MWIPVVKRNVLKHLAEMQRMRRRVERREEQRARYWRMNVLSDIVSTLETLLRGFFLGFGATISRSLPARYLAPCTLAHADSANIDAGLIV